MSNKLDEITITKYDLLFESRLSKVEATMENINSNMREIRLDIRDLRSDFRWIFGTMITFGIGILGLMAKGFQWI